MLYGGCSVCLPLSPPMAHTASTHTREAVSSRVVLRRGPKSAGTAASELAGPSNPHICFSPQAVPAHHPDVSSGPGLWTGPRVTHGSQGVVCGYGHSCRWKGRMFPYMILPLGFVTQFLIKLYIRRNRRFTESYGKQCPPVDIRRPP